jgi:tetratricopeptide (TPR) repeat protein
MENRPKEAIEAYKEYISIHSRNHVIWHNMGIAYVLLKDRIIAEKCFKKSLEIKPDYEIAKRNTKILNKATQKDIERMAKEYRVMMVNKGKEMEISYDD